MVEEKKPMYVKRGCNVPLKKPWTKKYFRPLIYSAVNELFSEGWSTFIPTWDDTDHFHFCGEKCGVMADVLQAEFHPDYGENGKLYALFIWLGCSKCGDTGFRKIYFKPSSYLAQKTFTKDNNVLIFGTEKEAYGKVHFRSVKE